MINILFYFITIYYILLIVFQNDKILANFNYIISIILFCIFISYLAFIFVLLQSIHTYIRYLFLLHSLDLSTYRFLQSGKWQLFHRLYRYNRSMRSSIDGRLLQINSSVIICTLTISSSLFALPNLSKFTCINRSMTLLIIFLHSFCGHNNYSFNDT